MYGHARPFLILFIVIFLCGSHSVQFIYVLVPLYIVLFTLGGGVRHSHAGFKSPNTMKSYEL